MTRSMAAGCLNRNMALSGSMLRRSMAQAMALFPFPISILNSIESQQIVALAIHSAATWMRNLRRDRASQ